MDLKVLPVVMREVEDDLFKQYALGSDAPRYILTHMSRYERDLRQIIPLLPEDAYVLDLGAYPYFVSEVLARYCKTVMAAGVPEYPSALKLRSVKVGVNCDVSVLPFESGSVDAVIFTEIFEHLYINPLGALEEIYRVLEPGGFLYLTTPNAIGVRRLARTLMRGTMADDVLPVLQSIKRRQMIGHFREYTPREITRLLEHVGFWPVETSTVNPYRKHDLEGLFFRMISTPFRNGREVIVSIARKPDQQPSASHAVLLRST